MDPKFMYIANDDKQNYPAPALGREVLLVRNF